MTNDQIERSLKKRLTLLTIQSTANTMQIIAMITIIVMVAAPLISASASDGLVPYAAGAATALMVSSLLVSRAEQKIRRDG